MARVGLRNLWARKLRTFLTGLAILLGVMMVSGTYVLTDTIDRAFDEIFVQSNQGVDAVVTTDQAIRTDDGQAPPLDADVLPEVQETDGVAEAEGLVFDPQVAVIDDQGERIGGNGAPTFGASALGERLDPQTYVAGERPATDEEVALDRGTAERGGFELGDQVELAGKAASREYELVGITTLGDVDSLGGATTATLTLPEAQAITGKEGQFDEIRVAAEEGTSSEELTARLEGALPETLLAETGAENVASQQQDIAEFTGFLKTALLIFAGVALFVAAFLIFNTFSITVAQRTREFAMLRTLGANRGQIVGSVVLEALALGLAAAVLGLLAGIGFAPAINSLFESLEID
ncbi:MAG TPA: FtsX-like permease family protein, partial [Thermoleophilaceae bacterium]|nr:FtsX-like permease family protein [Thermoleophilaceae bacterium]